MKRLPTETSIRHLCDSLRTLAKIPKGGRNRTELDLLEARLIHAVDRDRTGSPVPDGYPRGTLGGTGGGPTITAPDEAGLPDVVPATAVEVVGIALADGDVERDRHHELTVRAVEDVERAIIHLNSARAALASIDDLTRTATSPGREATCAHCTPHLPDANARPVHRRGTVGDRLLVATDLCEPCYFFVLRSADAGSRAGALPTPEQIAHHDRTGTWKLRLGDRLTNRVQRLQQL